MQSWIISTNENPLCFIAFSIISWLWSKFRALHLATKVAPEDKASKIGFNGSQLTLNGYPFKEKDLLHQAMSQALVLKGVFRDFYSQDWFVKSVLVFSSDKAFLQLNWKPIRNVSVVQKRSLLKYLEAGLPSFPRDQQKLLEQILIPLTKS